MFNLIPSFKKKSDEETQEIKKQKASRKKLKERKKRQKKNKKENVRESNEVFAPLFGYDYRPSYIDIGDRCATVLKIVNKYGTNRNESLGWFINLIPSSNEVGGNTKTILVEGDKPMDSKTQSDIFRNNMKKVMKGYSEENSFDGETDGDRHLKDLMIQDLSNASIEEVKNSAIAIDSFVYLLIFGDTPYHVSELLRKINENYKDTMNGVQAMSVAGNQEKMLKNIFEPPKGSKVDYTWMSTDFAGNEHAVRRGLNDSTGVSIGGLTEDYVGGQALMSLYESINKRAIIGAYESSTIYEYHDYSDLTGSSLWGQRIANDAMTRDHRVFHIVMNGFEYGADDFVIEGEESDTKFLCPISVEEEIERIDLSKGGLNPIEMFGDKERDKDNISEIFNMNIHKLSHMFDLMSGRNLSQIEKTTLEESLIEFYRSEGMWSDEAERYPNSARVFGLQHDTVPIMGTFTAQLASLVQRTIASGDASVEDIREAKHLQKIMDNHLRRHRSIFNNHTTLPDPKAIDKMQLYYDLSRLQNDPNMLEAQFLNVFNYVMSACEEGDVIMFHGLDRVSIDTLDVLKTRISSATRQGIKLVYLFDTIGGGGVKKAVDYANVFNTEGVLYQSLDNDFGYTILGTMTLRDLKIYEEKVKQKLTQKLKGILTATNRPYQYQIRRPSDLTTVMVQAQFFI